MSRKDASAVVGPDGCATSLKQAVLESLGRIVAVPLGFLGGRLKSFLPGQEKETFTAIQDRDPYLENLLLVLNGRK